MCDVEKDLARAYVLFEFSAKVYKSLIFPAVVFYSFFVNDEILEDVFAL
jgi:hypothetical protein